MGHCRPVRIVGPDYAQPLSRVTTSHHNNITVTEERFAPYFEARGRFRLDPVGRAAGHTHWVEENREAGELTVAQVLVDPEEQNDWELVFTVDLAASHAAQSVVLRLGELRPIGAY
jgi:hypothetical protein